MDLIQALRLGAAPCLALVGAGGKTTALFQLARQLKPPVVVTTSTHLATSQLDLADRHWVVQNPDDISNLNKELISCVSVLTGGEAEPGRMAGLKDDLLEVLRSYTAERGIPLLIEADGSRQKPVKAPADHEPAIPPFVSQVVVVAGLSALGKPLTSEWVHRPELYAGLAGLRPGAEISQEGLARELLHPQGGIKNIPSGARRTLLLNQADSQDLRDAAETMVGAAGLLSVYDSVVVSSLAGPQARVFGAHEPAAAVILAAGGARRYRLGGRALPKQLLTWGGETFVRRVASSALSAGLQPVIVVLGAYAEQVKASLAGLPVTCVLNEAWEAGQSTSIRTGLKSLPERTGSVLFMLADQPQVPSELVRRLVEKHAAGLPALVAPVVAGRRANPVLFDRLTFPELLKLTGDIGGRGLFAKESPFTPEWVPWDDPDLLVDVDTPEDYQALLERLKP
jgi:molybdenum cofactor cytidylyltransferase